MELSIVIPVLDESKKIGRDIEIASTLLENNRLAGEIIVVDDGSRDGTSEVARNIKVPAGITLKVVRFERNHGKGYDVRRGIQQSCGEYVMFADSGGFVP